ncbi:MAG TPA: nucleotidyl transferase AbiEii/AbiGii toxin family protein, partial [Solirubrobacteraceae bacterium]|nr:nucleotidyl transferase AbiEii/AbiGii toxin family protein [Solirubrobacteraceae bacterium]
LRLGLGARSTKDVDIVFRGKTAELLNALEEAFEYPYSGFEFRRKGEPQAIRDTGSRRITLQVSFQRRAWQTLTVEIARPEADESDLVPSAISLADFKLESPECVTCLSLRYQIAQKIHAVTENPDDGRPNLRHWDLIDLILLEALLGEDLWRVREACVWTFEDRATHDWPPTLKVPEAWSEPYRFDALQISADLPGEVQSAAAAVTGFIAAIDVARPGDR